MRTHRIDYLFHTLCSKSNKATNQFKTQNKEAITGLEIAYKLAAWIHQSFGKS